MILPHSRSLSLQLHSPLSTVFSNDLVNSLTSSKIKSFSAPTIASTGMMNKLPLSSRSNIYRTTSNCLHFRVSASQSISQSTSSSHWNTASCYSSSASVQGPSGEQVKDDGMNANKLEVLKQKIEAHEINFEPVRPGFYSHLICPKCNGGRLVERSLSFHISQSQDFSMWRCFRFECGWAGQAFIDDREMPLAVNNANKSKSFKKLVEKGLALEPLGDRLIAYFAERGISRKCLQRNAVMQVSGEQDVIAFSYRQNGELVGCKYRCINKRFWQDKRVGKLLYGLDDIVGVKDIIIVEGEMDKLSMEEAGFSNCVSVPGGAPQKVTAKDLPPWQKDIAYQYIWNCKAHLDKVSCIILATDNDSPGHALAEELARRLGKDRCWRVQWPQREDFSSFKDANEVLVELGPAAIGKMIEDVQPYT